MALRDDANELNDILRKIKEAMDEAAKSGMGIADGMAASKESLSGLIDSSKTLSEYSKKSSKATFDEVVALDKKIKKEKESLVNAQAALQTQKSLAEKQKEANRRLIERISDEKQSLLQKKINNTISEEELDILRGKESVINQAIAKNEELTKTLEDQGAQLKQNEDVLNAMGDMEKDLDKIGNRFGPIKDSIKDIYKGLDKVKNPINLIAPNLSGWLSPLGMINKLIEMTVGYAQELDKQLGASAKSMNITYAEAGKMRTAMIESAEASGDMYLNAKNTEQAVLGLNASLGTSVQFSDMSKNLQKDVELMGKLASYTGLTAEQTQAMQKFSMAGGKELEKNTKELMASYKVQGMNNKMLLNEKDALKAIANTSKAIQVSMGGSGKELGKALAAAKGLGVELNKVDGIAGSLLEFEQSIENELSAELLLGKDINLEKARQAALNNDLATVAEEITKQVGSAADFQKMNRIQQEAIAKATGMQREELAAALQEQEAMKALSANSIEDAKAQFDLMVEKKGLEEATKQLGDEKLAQQWQQQSIEEQRQIAQEKMMDSLANEIIPALTWMNESFQGMFEKIKKIFDMFGGWKTILIAIGAILTAKFVASMVQMVTSVTAKLAAARAYRRELSAQEGKLNSIAAKEAAIAASKVAGAEASTLGAATGPILAGIAAVMAVVGGLTMMNDGMIGPSGKAGFGDRVLLGKEGAISFNNKDTIVAGTDLFTNDGGTEPGKSTRTSGTTTTQTGGTDMSAMVNAITALANRPIDIGIDGNKVIEATTGANPKTDGDEMAKNSYRIQ